MRGIWGTNRGLKGGELGPGPWGWRRHISGRTGTAAPELGRSVETGHQLSAHWSSPGAGTGLDYGLSRGDEEQMKLSNRELI